jgi:aerobic carbon-monoxide dehydrogenase medium subunit
LAEHLKRGAGRTRIIGGGTGIYELATRGLLSEVDTLVDITGVGLAYVRMDKRSLKIGAAATMRALLEAEPLRTAACGAVLDALVAIQPLQVKNVATVGGAICTALPFFDLPTALMATEAVVSIGPATRAEKLQDFVQGYLATNLASHEYVREVEIPLDRPGRSSAFQKFALTSDDWAMINCGVSATLDVHRRIRDPVVVFGGGVGGKPVRANGVEKSLEGVEAEDRKVAEVFGKKLADDVETTADMRSSAEYRLELAKVLGRRTTLAACKRAG